MAQLASYQYGKDLVRFLRIVRADDDPARQHIAEYTVRCLLTGAALETSYTQADNARVVPTDTVKNTINVLAKHLDGTTVVLVPEAFALHVAAHFLTKYAHIDGVQVHVDAHRWTRIDLGPAQGGQHKHSFVRDGESLRTAHVVLSRVPGQASGDFAVDVLEGGVKNLLVLKSSGSAFYGYHVDELTTLRPVQDRIFSTSIDCTYSIKLPVALSSYLKLSAFSQPSPSTADPTVQGPYPSKTEKAQPCPGPIASPAPINFDALHDRVLAHTLRLFATDASASVQATLFKMAEAILADGDASACCAHVQGVEYTLPNKHYVPIDLGFAGLANLGESEAEVFWPQANPSGLIKAKIVRTSPPAEASKRAAL